MKHLRLNRLGKYSTALTAVFLLMLGGATVANAVPSSASVSDLKVEKQPGGTGEALTQYDLVKFSGNWSATDPKAGDSFAVGMPPELSFGSEMSFPLLKDGVIVAQCTAPAGPGSTLRCVFNDAMEELGSSTGDFWVEMSASGATGADHLVAQVDGSVVTIPLPGGGGIEGVETTDPNLEEINKFGSQDGAKFVWTITVPSGTAPSTLRIDDAMANTAPHEWHHFDDSEAPRLFERSTVSAGGNWAPGSEWVQVDESKFSLIPSADKSGFSFVMDSDVSMAYQLTYFTKPTGIVIPGDTFSNDATINGTSVSSGSVEYRQTGGGGTEGSPFGRFSVSKTISNNEGKVPEGTEFTVRYTVGDISSDMTVSLDGETVTSPRLAPGTIVKIEEVSLPEIDGVTWSSPVFTIDGATVSTFTIVADQTLEVSLMNSLEEATPEVPEQPNPEVPEKPGTEVPAKPQPGLAVTGSQSVMTFGLAAGGLLALGAVLFAIRRKTAL